MFVDSIGLPPIASWFFAGDIIIEGTHGIRKTYQCEVRVPIRDELPKHRLLTYGTSITHGAAATMPHLPYVRQLAWRLGIDLMNFGVGGACQCEPAFADYMASLDDWTVGMLALSVNMIGAGFTPEAFYERVSYLVNTVAGANSNRPVMCVTIYPHARDFFGVGNEVKAPPETYRQKLRDAVANCPHPNLHLAEGADILTDPGGLTTDLIHPGDFGMIQMGENLAARMRTLISD